MIISPGLFFIFSKFWFLGLLGGKRAKSDPNWQKILSVDSISQEPYIIWLSFMVHICKMIISSGTFFIFSKFWFFGSIVGVKGQKTVQNGKKLCMLCFTSQEPHFIWLSFMVQMCKIISPGVIFIFKILIFGVVRAWKGKKWPKMTNFCLSHLIFQAPYIIWSTFMVHMYL